MLKLIIFFKNIDTCKNTCYNVNMEGYLLQGGWDDQKRTDKTLKEQWFLSVEKSW